MKERKKEPKKEPKELKIEPIPDVNGTRTVKEFKITKRKDEE